MKHLKIKAGMALVACLGMSMSVNAQDVTCSDLVWNDSVTSGADAACREVVMKDGSMFAKMTAEVLAQQSLRTAYRWILPDGSKSGRVMSDPNNRQFITMIDDKPVMLKDLAEGQQVNVYLGDTFWSLPAPEPVAIAAEPAPEPEPVVEPEPMPEPEPAPVVLPKTGSQLNWLALMGGLFLLLGGALRFARK